MTRNRILLGKIVLLAASRSWRSHDGDDQDSVAMEMSQMCRERGESSLRMAAADKTFQSARADVWIDERGVPGVRPHMTRIKGTRTAYDHKNG